jgi:hypothetical protein
MTYIAAHALGLAALLLVFHTTGLLLALRVPALDSVGRRTGLLHIATGTISWSYFLFALASLQLLRTRVLFVTITAIFVSGGVLTLSRRPRRSANAVSRRGASWSLSAHTVAWLAPGAILTLLFMSGLSPWVGWDGLVAHLALPKIYLTHGGFRNVPFNAYSNWPLNVEMLYMLAMAVQDYVLAKLVHVAFLGLLAVAVYRYASRAAALWAGIVAASLLLANDIVQVEAPNGDIDIAVAFFFFMAVTLAIEFCETLDRPSLVMSGVFCGGMAGSKITGLASIACVLPLIISGAFRRRTDRRLREVAADAALFVGPAVAFALPWLIRSALYSGDPLYPVFSKYLGGVDWNAAIDEQFWNWQRSIGMGRGFKDYLLLPIRVVLFGGAEYDSFAGILNKSWILLVPLAVIVSPLVPLIRRCLLPAALYFAVWAVTSQQTRFLISVLPLLSVAAAVALSWIVTFVSSYVAGQRAGGDRIWTARMCGRVLAAGCIAASVATLAWSARYMAPRTVRVSRELLAHSPDLRTWKPHPVYALIRDKLPASARLMLLDTNQGFFVDRDYLADSFFEASRLNDLIREADGRAELPELFARLGVTHVLVEHVDWVPYPEGLWRYLGDPGTAEPIYRDGTFTLYELRRTM